MGEYRKRRVAVSAVEAADAASSCICELSAKLPVAPYLFVLAPDGHLFAKIHNAVSAALSDPVKKWVCLVRRSKLQCSHKAIHATSNGWLTPYLVANFESWMDQRSSGKLNSHLDAGLSMIFAQVSNTDEETHAYRTVDRYCTGSVQLHDLPV